MEQMMCGARIDTDRNKKHALDFVLWKEAKPFEPSWKSPWGEGRPGWHIECSVMSTDLLGPQFDIHGGGLDLIFPHHENEIAQAEAVTGKTFAKYWIHNGLLFVNGEKMSKSLGNFITISDFLSDYNNPDLLKLAFLHSHYRSAMNYSDEKLEEARRARERIMIFMNKTDRLCKENSVNAKLTPEIINRGQDVADSLSEKFKMAMDDDFNTPVALSVLFEAVKTGNDYLLDGNMSFPEKVFLVNAVKNFILKVANVLGLSLRNAEVEEDFRAEVKRMLGLREKAREQKNFSEADRLRDALAGKGVVIEDTPEGPVWRKK
jgi:cysteinyl-tRNA synthetase